MFSVAVLYFELIYQAIMVRDPTLDSFAWFIHMGSQENKYLRNVIGQQVWEFLRELVMLVSERSVRIIGNTSYKILEETPLGIAVWLFASLVEKPTAQGTCAGFTITGASQYDSLIDGDQRYHQLMKLIR